MGIRFSEGNERIELLRARWAAGEATPEEIREVRDFLTCSENSPKFEIREVRDFLTCSENSPKRSSRFFNSLEFWALVAIGLTIYLLITEIMPTFREWAGLA